MPISQLAEISRTWLVPLLTPSTDGSKKERHIQLPLHAEVCGIDGRVDGAARTFPGFRSLGIGRAYLDGSGNPLGPLLVGYGIDHVTNASAVGSEVLEWKYFNPYYHPHAIGGSEPVDGGIPYFRAASFKKSSGASSEVCGFVVLCPYDGPEPPTTAGKRYNLGLPVDQGGRYQWMFIYWDDEPYPHPVRPDLFTPHDPGWRAFLLSRPSSKSASLWFTGDIQGAGANNMGVAEAVDKLLISNPTNVVVENTEAQYWGPNPNDKSTYLATWATDCLVEAITGPCVLYYSSTLKRVRLRPWANYSAAALSFVAANATVFTNPTTGSPAVSIGYISTVTDTDRTTKPSQIVAYAASLYNPDTGDRVFVDPLRISMTPTARTDVFAFAVPIDIPIEYWSWGYTTLEAWRSVPFPQMWEDSVPDFLPTMFRESAASLGTLPAYSSGSDLSSASRRYWVAYGGRGSALTYPVLTPAPRTTLAQTGADDLVVSSQTPAPEFWRWERPPSDTSRLTYLSGTTFACVRRGYNFETNNNSANNPTTTIYRRKISGVPADLRWTDPIFPTPELFDDSGLRWNPDENAGTIYDLVTVAGFTFAIGSRGVVAFFKQGGGVSTREYGEDLAPVSSKSWCAGSSALFVLSSTGLWIISALDGSVRNVEGVANILTADEWWGTDLQFDSMDLHPNIGIEIDEVGQCLFIYNTIKSRALCVWLSTGFITFLDDFVWTKSSSGTLVTSVKHPDTWTYVTKTASSAKRRAFFVEPVNSRYCGAASLAAPSGVRYGCQWDIHHADFSPELRFDWSPSHGMFCETSQIRGRLASASALDLSVFSGSLLSAIANYAYDGVYGGFSGAPPWPPASGATSFAHSEFTVAMPSGDAIWADFLNRALSWSFIRIFTPDLSTLVRRQISKITWTGSALKILVFPQITGAELTALNASTSRYLIAPIITRIVSAPLVAGDARDLLGVRKAVVSASHKCDVLSVRSYRDTNESLVSRTADITDAVVRLLGHRAVDDKTPSNDLLPSRPKWAPYIPQYPHWDVTKTLLTNVGRMKLATTALSSISRYVTSTAKSLPFSGDQVSVGIEIMSVGLGIDLVSLYATGTIRGSSARQTTT